ncbi:DUF5107 domain-containing protein [Streptomyces sp. NBC_01803]|uniref:DUF5107 domain-containing protein n=1 Tax=Streptomyces sp. NBC_01803 TaxID=2975946 RepID=UPI002DDC55F6|nr:DUF5107 domain-containing protein [Streptomyces sp. NBC_01803]WSA47507.1 DUF5107 domain-containing protein [Streptomyces sp. NBC_01803]
MARTGTTTIRRGTLTLPVAALGPENPLPALLPPAGAPAARSGPGRRQRGHAPLTSVLPVRLRDGYGRRRVDTELDVVVIENDRLSVTVLPGFGGRIHSLRHKPTGRDLLYTNPVLQPVNRALNGAWFSGGIEWNIGAHGRSTLACAPVHAAVVAAPDGGRMLRLWEWERLRDTPFQVDLWLPDGSDFLHVGVRVRNPHERTVPLSWWSSAAVPEGPGTRVLAPADEAWQVGPEREPRRLPVPGDPLAGAHPADWFYEIPPGTRPWIAAFDQHGDGLAQTSTAALRGRRLSTWGTGPAGRRRQRRLTEENAPGHAEIQAGPASHGHGHVPLRAGEELSWLEAYGPLTAASRDEAERRLAAALPEEALRAAYAAWLPYADLDPKEILHTGSGWGALEVERGGFELPGTPFDPAALGPEQRPWLELLRGGRLPEEDFAPERPPGPSLVSRPWRERLEYVADGPLTYYHLGVAQWHAGDRAQARRSWERSLAAAKSPWALRCLAVAHACADHPERAAAYALAATELALDTASVPIPALAALAREAVPALLAVGRAAEARGVLDRLPPGVRRAGRFRLLDVRVLIAEGERAAARAAFDAGFDVADLRDDDESLARAWAALTDEPLPERYDFGAGPVA